MSNPHEPRTMMGFATPGDSRVSITVRDWSALKLALWRSKTGWETVVRAALEIVDRCRHVDGCPGKDSELEPCVADRYESAEPDLPATLKESGCPDREQRMSALVVLGAARMFAPIDARRLSNEPHTAPSREYYSEILASFAAAMAELEALREKYEAGVSPPKNEGLALPTRTPEKIPQHLLEVP